MPRRLQTSPAFTLDLGERVEMTFQWIPAGRFRMGSRGESQDEEPRHWVQITRPFYLGTFPVTQEQFARWKPEHEFHFTGNRYHPAESIDWNEATQYCSWLTAQIGAELPDGYEAGLPTEAQWEYACRAGADTEYHTGDGEAALHEAGWYDGNSGDETHDVGLKLANRFGLYDMHGNVWEWCADTYDEHSYKKQLDGVCDPFTQGENTADRVTRGGGWIDSPAGCRAAYRYWRRSENRSRNQGFRVCLFLGPCPGQAERAEQAGNEGRGSQAEASESFDDFADTRFPT